MTRRRFFGGVVAALLLTASPLAAHAAQASDPAVDVLLVSEDGTTFTPSLTLGLFGDIDLVAPADTVTETVWLRNDSDEPGRLRIDLTSVDPADTDLAQAIEIAVAVPNGSDDRSARLSDIATAPSGCIVLSTGRVLAPGETVAVTATASVDPALGERAADTGRAGTGEAVSFDLRAFVSDAAAPPLDASACAFADVPVPAPDPDDALPDTGSDIPLWLIVIGGGAVVAGTAIVAARRPRRDETAS